MSRAEVLAWAAGVGLAVVSGGGCGRSGEPPRAAPSAPPASAALDPAACTDVPAGVAAPADPPPAPSPIPPAAENAAREAESLAARGELDEALARLRAAASLAPDHPMVVYDTAAVYVLKHEPAAAVALLARDTARFGPLGYQALGNAYDALGKPACALRVYGEGMRAFPADGGNDYDAGVVHEAHGDVAGALRLWEAGIARAPLYASSYLAAARRLVGDDPAWAQLYAEAFLNLAPEGPRSGQARKLIHSVYFSLLGAGLVVPEDPPDWIPPLGQFWRFVNDIAIEELRLRATASSDISIEQLHSLRAKAIELWVESGGDLLHPNPVVSRIMELQGAGLLEAYDHVLFSDVAPQEAAAYTRDHQNAVGALVRWMRTHPFQPAAGSMRRDGRSPPASRKRALSATMAFFASPVSFRGEAACLLLSDFAERGGDVDLQLPGRAPAWLGIERDGPGENKWKRCSFLAGNVRAQLERGVAEDAPYEGVLGVLEVYDAVRADERMRSRELEELRRRRDEGTLRAYLQSAR